MYPGYANSSKCETINQRKEILSVCNIVAYELRGAEKHSDVRQSRDRCKILGCLNSCFETCLLACLFAVLGFSRFPTTKTLSR